ncbi:MAG TPA: PDZ domain-containing protein, partial [Xanthomonadales bacterium]|nr:PDZ domain-containing protein [Xanthomonadales bacterium]
TEEQPSGRLMLSILAGLVAIWGVLGWLDLEQQAEAGFVSNSRQLVTEVTAASPAEQAGMQVGDQVTKIDGYPADDAYTVARLPRMKAGNVRVFTVQRDDGEHEISIRYEPLPAGLKSLQRSSAVLGFCFLLFPLLALYRQAKHATRILVFMGIGLGLAALDGPYTNDPSARALAAAISSLFVGFGMASVVQFLLVFPRRKPFMDKAYAKLLVYLPAFLLWLLVAWRLLFTPPATELLNRFHGLLMGVVEGGYFLVALFLLLHNYSKTDRAQRQRLALNLMLWGTILGLMPALVAQLATAFSPGAQLPGQDYYFMSLLLIPLSWAFSASRS